MANIFTASKELERVSAELAELRPQLEAAIAARDALESRHKESEAQAALLIESGKAMAAELETVKAELATAKEAAAKVPAAVAAKAAETVAALGHTPVPAPSGAVGVDAVMSRADFFKMSPAAQMKFINNGGKLS